MSILTPPPLTPPRLNNKKDEEFLELLPVIALLPIEEVDTELHDKIKLVVELSTSNVITLQYLTGKFLDRSEVDVIDAIGQLCLFKGLHICTDQGQLTFSL